MAKDFAKKVNDTMRMSGVPIDLRAAEFKRPAAISMLLRKVKRLGRRMDIARAALKSSHECACGQQHHYQNRSCLRNIHMRYSTKALIKNRSIHKLVQTGVKP